MYVGPHPPGGPHPRAVLEGGRYSWSQEAVRLQAPPPTPPPAARPAGGNHPGGVESQTSTMDLCVCACVCACVCVCVCVCVCACKLYATAPTDALLEAARIPASFQPRPSPAPPLTWGMDDLLLDGPALPRPHLVLTEVKVEVVVETKLPKGSQNLKEVPSHMHVM